MYSFNFNEEDKNRKKKNSDSSFSAESNLSGVQNIANGGQESDDNGYGVALTGTDSNGGMAKADSGFSPSGVENNGLHSLTTDFWKNRNKNSAPAPMTARDFMGAKYKKSGVFGDSFFRYAVPKASPERAEALYSVSPAALDDVASNYFKDELSSKFNNRLEDAKNRSDKAYADYAGDPFVAMRQVRETYDPEAIMKDTMTEIDVPKLRKMVEPLARRGGFDADMYIEDYVKPALRDKLLDDYIDKNKPKGSGEYILRSSLNNSLVGKVANIGFGNKSLMKLENESLARYDANRLENLAAGIGSLLVDAPVFSGFGSFSGSLVGKAASISTNRLAKRVLLNNMERGMTEKRALQVAQRYLKENLKSRIAQSAAVGGLTLGNYDFAHSVADDVIYNESIDAGKALGSFTKGFVTGALASGVGSGLKKATAGLTGGKKMMASTGVLSAESAIFTLPAEMEKALHDVEIEPVDLVNDFAESMATLGVMKVTHWRPKGAEYKLKEDGTLKDELKLSKSEQAELREMNINPVEFMNEVERNLNLPSYGLGSAGKRMTEAYLEMMQSNDVSAATKSKLMYIVENKLTSTPPVAFDYSVERRRNGEWLYTTYDMAGKKVESRIFEHAGNLKSHMLVEKSRLRKNRIAAHERELLQGVDSENLLRQAGLFAKESGVSIDDVSQALYKRAQNMPLDGMESAIVRDIVERASYDESGMVQYLADMRRSIEKKHGIEDGSLLVKINESYYKCSDAENSALDEYEALVRDEVKLLKKGTDKERAADFRRMGENSSFKGMTHDEVKAKEVQDYYTAHPDKPDSVGSGYREKPIKIDDDENSGYVWSYEGIDNTVEDINRLKEAAGEYAKKYGFDVEFITNERQIPYPDEDNAKEVSEYNHKIRSLGWLDGEGKITINLPNIPSVEEVEKTVVHECVGHGGLLRLFGKHLHLFLEDVYRKATGEVRVAMGKVKSQYPKADNYTIVEEYLANLTEKAVLSPAERGVLSNFKDFVRNSLVRFNIYTGRNRRISESDLMSLLRQHAKYVERRTAPSDYRKRLFGEFDAAKQNEMTYYDRNAYEEDTRAKIAGGEYFRKTPSPFYNSKLLRHYELLPENKKQEVLKKWGSTDEQVMDLLSSVKRRVPAKKEGNATLMDIHDDKSFYETYPELAGLPVDIVDEADAPVSYDSRNKRVIVDRSFFANPDNKAYMSRVLQDVVHDYDGFNKAVSMNLIGINSMIGRKYDEAKKVLDAIDNAKRSMPDFDMDKKIDKVFEREYGFTPDEFKKRFPTLDEFTIYRLTGKGVPFSDNVSPSASAGDRQHSGSVVNDLGDLMKYFNGPLDIVYQKLQQSYSDEPRQRGKGYVPAAENDHGYSEFKKREDDKRKRLSDGVEYRKWRDAFRHLDDELENLN